MRWTMGRAVAMAVAVLLLGYGVRMMMDGNRRQREFEGWETAMPVDAAVDFSQPGQVELPFTQTCATSHGEVVALRVPPEVLEQMVVRLELAKLQATLEIVEKDGGRVLVSVESDKGPVSESSDGEVPLFHFAPFPQGEYVARLTVPDGVPSLQGVGQRLEGRYVLCGLEGWPAQISRVIGVGSLVVGIVVAGEVMRRLRKSPGGEDATPLG